MRTLSCYSESGAEPYGAVGAVGRWDRWGRTQGPHSGDSAPTTRHAARRGIRARPAALPEAAAACGLGRRHRTRLRHRAASLRSSVDERRRWVAEAGSTAVQLQHSPQRSLARPTLSAAAARATRRLCALDWSATASVHCKHRTRQRSWTFLSTSPLCPKPTEECVTRGGRNQRLCTSETRKHCGRNAVRRSEERGERTLHNRQPCQDDMYEKTIIKEEGWFAFSWPNN